MKTAIVLNTVERVAQAAEQQSGMTAEVPYLVRGVVQAVMIQMVEPLMVMGVNGCLIPQAAVLAATRLGHRVITDVGVVAEAHQLTVLHQEMEERQEAEAEGEATPA
jgi:hypothetical protein